MTASAAPRVVIVDDEPALLGALRRMVQRIRPDAVVVYASDPENAIWQIEATAVQLVITDLRMQGDRQAGMHVVAAAKEANVPVVVVSGVLSAADIEALGRKTVPLLEKHDITTERLAQLIDQALAAA